MRIHRQRLSEGNNVSKAILPFGATFDGTNDNLSRAGLTGASDGKTATIAMRIEFTGKNGSAQEIIHTSNSAFQVRKNTTNKIEIAAKNAAGTGILLNVSTSAYTVASGVLDLLISFNLGTGTQAQIYVNDSDNAAAATTFTNDNVDFTVAALTVGSWVTGTNRLAAKLHFLWADITSAIDFSTEANRRKFFDANGNLVYLGDKGQLPTGSSPAIYLSNPFDQFEKNRGTGGDFTVTGALSTI